MLKKLSSYPPVKLLIISVLILGLWSLSSSVRASDDEQIIWYVMYDKDSPVKQIKTTVSPLSSDGEEGIYRTAETSQLVGIQGIPISSNLETKFTSLSTKDFLPVRFTYSIMSKETYWQLCGTVDEETKEVYLKSNYMHDITVTPPTEEWYFADDFLAKLLTEGFELGKEYKATVWNNDFLNFIQISVTFIEEIEYEYNGNMVNTYKTRITTDHSDDIAYIDASNISYFLHDINLSYKSVRFEENELPEIEPGSMSYYINTNMLTTEQAISGTLELSWIEEGEEKLSFTDNRQKVISETKDGDLKRRTIQIVQDTRDFAGARTLSNAYEGLKGYEEYLQPTQFIECDKEEIINLAKQIIGNETDSWSVVKLLLNWTHNYLEPLQPIGALSATNILKTMKGNPIEYNILFASLARALGIPTRISFGKQYNPPISAFEFHVWNEVWMGEWVAVDPYYNESAPHALLIKMGDGKSINEVVKFNNMGIKELKIIILELITFNKTTREHTRHKAQLKDEYIDFSLGFRLKIPTDKWWVTECESLNQKTLMVKSKNHLLDIVTITWGPAFPGFTAELILPLLASSFEASMPETDLKQIEKGKLSIGDKNNSFVKYEIYDGDNDITGIGQLVVIDNDGKFFMFFYCTIIYDIEAKDASLIELLTNLETSI